MIADTKPIQKYRLVVQYPPSPTKTGGAYVKDQEGVKNFSKDPELLKLEQRDIIDVERTYNPAKGGYDSSFTIVRWAPHVSDMTAAEVQTYQPLAKPFLRPRTDPHDQMQMFVTALMKEWMTGYAATLMNPMPGGQSPGGQIAPVNAVVVLQAMEALTAAYQRYHDHRPEFTTGPTPPPPPQRDDMNDEIPEWAR